MLLRRRRAGAGRGAERRPRRGPGQQGACVIAKSYEMKRMGVGTGMPIWDALRACPDGLYLKRDFRWYEVLSTSSAQNGTGWVVWRDRQRLDILVSAVLIASPHAA